MESIATRVPVLHRFSESSAKVGIKEFFRYIPQGGLGKTVDIGQCQK